ncbi:MAG TPA: hypothetical protein ENI45_04485 [Thermoplasmatales archaeon]|nr:hypothetical protein [Thermoplasmatales archaeon]
MADGTRKPVEQVKIGDMLLSYNQWNNTFASAEVLDVIVKTRDLYTLNDGLLTLTDDHPVYIRKTFDQDANHKIIHLPGTPLFIQGWGAIDPLKSVQGNYQYLGYTLPLEVGDEVFTEEGGWMPIYSIKHLPEKTLTYTFTLNRYRTFFANGVMVANADAPGTPLNPSCCFLPGTKITMWDGSVKNIEEIRAGDRVLSYDVENKTFVSTTVTFTLSPKRFVYSINNGLIYATADHPFFVKKPDGRTGWAAIDPNMSKVRYNSRDAMQLEVGDKLMQADGTWVPVNSITYYGQSITYTFGVNRVHTYLANGLVVSNALGKGCSTPIEPPCGGGGDGQLQ